MARRMAGTDGTGTEEARPVERPDSAKEAGVVTWRDGTERVRGMGSHV